MSKIDLSTILSAHFDKSKTPKTKQVAILKTLPVIQEALDVFLVNRQDKVAVTTELLEATGFFLPPEEVKKAEAFFDAHPSGMKLEITRTPNFASYKHAAIDPSEEVQQPIEKAEEPVAIIPEPEPELVEKPAPATARNLSGIHMLVPVNRPIVPAVVTSLLGQWKATLPQDVRENLAVFDLQNDTLIHHARNLLADRFLKSGKEWSFWMDGDVLAPNGNPAWFKRWTGTTAPAEFSSIAAVESLTRHPGKKIVSAVYCQRNPTRKILAPDSFIKEHGEEIRLGPSKKVVPSPWVPFGCVAVHRDVFLAIKAAYPELEPKTQGPNEVFNFFGADTETNSEDVVLCKRAKAAGHQAYFDLGVHCAHVGSFAYLP